MDKYLQCRSRFDLHELYDCNDCVYSDYWEYHVVRHSCSEEMEFELCADIGCKTIAIGALRNKKHPCEQYYGVLD